MINAPKEAMLKVLEKYESVRQLCDNQWIFLMAMNDEGEITGIYDGGLEWRRLDVEERAVKNRNEKFVGEVV